MTYDQPYILNTIDCKSILLPLQLDDCMNAEGRATHGAVAGRVGGEENKITLLIPAFSHKV
jgi:hypothetical protein